MVEGGGRDSPRRATSFLVARQERRQRSAPHRLRPLRGNLRRGACGVRRITHYAAAQLRSDKCGESDHEAGVSCGTPATPQAPRHRRSQKGVESPIRAIAALGPWPLAERSDGPSGCWTRIPSGCACGAQGMADQGSRLSERRRREFERDPASTEHRRLPAAQRRDADSRVAFLLGTFLWRSKE